jgi:protein gp37
VVRRIVGLAAGHGCAVGDGARFEGMEGLPVSDRSAIEWTEATWNPTTGCDRVSEGCDNCYAMTLAKRLKAMGSAKYQNDGDPRTSGPGFGLTTHPDALRVPYGWKSPRTVFVNSMSDLFHARVPIDFVRQVFEVMAGTPQHTYQVLTKRARRLKQVSGRLDWPPNVWMGVSVETAKELPRVDDLRHVPAAVRFLSCEPLLGPLDGLELDGIDWVITGGESGPGARPMDTAWAADIVQMSRRAGCAPFVKQLGSRWGRSHKDIERFPAELQVREYPKAPAYVPS